MPSITDRPEINTPLPPSTSFENFNSLWGQYQTDLLAVDPKNKFDAATAARKFNELVDFNPEFLLNQSVFYGYKNDHAAKLIYSLIDLMKSDPSDTLVNPLVPGSFFEAIQNSKNSKHNVNMDEVRKRIAERGFAESAALMVKELLKNHATFKEINSCNELINAALKVRQEPSLANLENFAKRNQAFQELIQPFAILRAIRNSSLSKVMGDLAEAASEFFYACMIGSGLGAMCASTIIAEPTGTAAFFTLLLVANTLVCAPIWGLLATLELAFHRSNTQQAAIETSKNALNYVKELNPTYYEKINPNLYQRAHGFFAAKPETTSTKVAEVATPTPTTIAAKA